MSTRRTPTSSWVRSTTPSGGGTIWRRNCAPIPSFFQINQAQTERLYAVALDFAALTGRETVLDLYCGIGTISLALSRRAAKVIGAEIVPQAIQDARENARRNGVENTEFFCGDAGTVAARLSGAGPHR